MRYIYFDFDGTLADSFSLGLDIADVLAPKFGFNKVDRTKIDYYRALSSQELLKEFKIPLIKVPVLAPLFKLELYKRIDDLKPYPGVEKMLSSLSKKYYVGILTSNTVENVNHFLKNHNLTEYISDIRSEFQLFGKHTSLKKIISKKKINKADIIYIGDETRDIEAANKTKIKSIAVSWGFNSEEVLIKYNPSFIASSLEEILISVEELFGQN